ncbi:MAG TPA: hypothetical protein V6C52_11520 [Coleofasciculaceae cyanobacterium]|jgi:hypothetical protein
MMKCLAAFLGGLGWTIGLSGLCSSVAVAETAAQWQDRIPAQVDPGAVLNWETNINRRIWEQIQYGNALCPEVSSESVILYQSRDGRLIDCDQFIREVLRRHERNLP